MSRKLQNAYLLCLSVQERINEFKSYYVNCFLFRRQNKTSWEEKNKNRIVWTKIVQKIVQLKNLKLSNL